LERENGASRNPFINAGALVVTNLLATQHNKAQEALLALVRELARPTALERSGNSHAGSLALKMFITMTERSIVGVL
jgi:glutaminase